MPTDVRYQGQGCCSVSCLTVKRRANRMLRFLRLSEVELSVFLCDDAQIRRLNRQYRGKDGICDVLSFSMVEGSPVPGTHRILGDIVISVPALKRRSAVNRSRPLDELTFLLAHGLLHLVGFDHRSPAEERRINDLARRLVASAVVR